MKPNKPQIVAKIVIEKTIPFVVLEVTTMVIAIDNHMAIIQIQIGKKTIEDVLLDGRSKVNIITK
jgi:hypothetical protein